MSKQRRYPLPLWKQRPELRSLAEQLAHAQRTTLRYLEGEDPIGVLIARGRLEIQLRAVEAAGWHPPAPIVTTARQLADLGSGGVVTDSDDATWICDPAGDWYGPAGAAVTPAELLRRRPLTVRHHKTQPAALDDQGAA